MPDFRTCRLLSAVSALCLLVGWMVASTASAEPLLQRFRAATITAQDLTAVERDYARYLGYAVRERGRVPAALARSWNTPRAAGRPYVLMSPDAAPDVFIRIVQGPRVARYRPLTTWGWNAIEIVVDDTDGTYERFRGGPFRVIGEPANLSGYPSIRAFQVEGRASEVLYLTSETGDRSRSPLPPPKGPIGRIFIMVVAGPEPQKLVDWYADTFGLPRGTLRDRPVGVLQRAQGLPPDRLLPLTTTRLVEQGNLIEIDGYSENAGVRPRKPGHLPPGIAVTTMSVRSLDAVRAPFLAEPAVLDGPLYGGRRSATLRGPAGELVELVEE
jgi:catechol 2,3-dioxygenase-like lactoylglutathione lyase family enzyme